MAPTPVIKWVVTSAIGVNSNRQSKTWTSISSNATFCNTFHHWIRVYPFKETCMHIFICRTANRNALSLTWPVIGQNHHSKLDFLKLGNRANTKCRNRIFFSPDNLNSKVVTDYIDIFFFLGPKMPEKKLSLRFKARSFFYLCIMVIRSLQQVTHLLSP